MYINKKILMIADYDAQRICGQTIHLNYLVKFFTNQNAVSLQKYATLKEIRQFDIIWFRSEKSFLKLFFFCILSRKSIIYDVSSFGWLELKVSKRPWLRIKFSWYIFKLASKVAQIRVISQAMKDYLVNTHQIRDDRISVFPIPIELPPLPTREHHDAKIHFLYVGSNRAWQGLTNLIQAFNRLEDDLDLILHCYGPPQKNTKNIIFHPLISHDELIQIIARDIDVVVVPREKNLITETVMPIKYAEAIYLKKHVLAADLPVLHEIATEKVVFIPDNELSSIIEGIKAFKRLLPVRSQRA
jgi:glycosyltransferase involved in cell wall biosynthesis